MRKKVSLPGSLSGRRLSPGGLSDGTPSALIGLATLLLLLCGPLLSGDLSADLSRVASTGAGARAAQDGSEQKGKKKKSKKSGKSKKSTLSPERCVLAPGTASNCGPGPDLSPNARTAREGLLRVWEESFLANPPGEPDMRCLPPPASAPAAPP